MDPRLRRILWVLVVASLALSGLSACSFSSLFGAGAGLSFAGVVTAVLLLLGTTTQTGCGPCLNMPVPHDVGPCLSADRHDVHPDVGPCLSPDRIQIEPADAGVGACLAPEPPDATSDARGPATPSDRALASADRNEVLESLRDRLPPDVKERLGLKKA